MQFTEEVEILKDSLASMFAGFPDLPDAAKAQTDKNKMKEILQYAAYKMQDNPPFFHPLYAGQMSKPPHPIARIAYSMAMWINPNNHELQGGGAVSNMEKEAVAELARMIGFKNHLGHLTGGGTLANMEALWVADKLHPGQLIVASQNAHYTHQRMCEVLGLPFASIPCTEDWRMDVNALETILQKGNVGTVVVTAGTTMTGSVDPLHEIVKLKDKYNFRIHVDAAYGGYHTLLSKGLGEEVIASFAQIQNADSVVIDPHKQGLQPYGCGCVLFNDPTVGRFYKHDSPYTYFSSNELHLGEISLECSRPGAAAVALWSTLKLFPLEKDGEMANNLALSHEAAMTLWEKINNDERFICLNKPDLDILVWAIKSPSASESSQLAEQVYNRCLDKGLHFVKAKISAKLLEQKMKVRGITFKADQDQVICLRSVLFKPEHLAWIDKIWQLLDKATNEMLRDKGTTARKSCMAQYK